MAVLPAHLCLSLKSAFMEEDIILGSDVMFYWINRWPLIDQKSGIEKSHRDLLRKMTQVIKFLYKPEDLRNMGLYPRNHNFVF